MIRHLDTLGQTAIREFPLTNKRRADIVAIDTKGIINIIEVKSGLADFTSDTKWPDYLAFCDRFYFAVSLGFPLDILPANCGIYFADGFGGELIRPAEEIKLPPARRKAMMLRLAQTAMRRLNRFEDPPISAR